MKQTICDACRNPMSDSDNALKHTHKIKFAASQSACLTFKPASTNQDICRHCIAAGLRALADTLGVVDGK